MSLNKNNSNSIDISSASVFLSSYTKSKGIKNASNAELVSFLTAQFSNEENCVINKKTLSDYVKRSDNNFLVHFSGRRNLSEVDSESLPNVSDVTQFFINKIIEEKNILFNNGIIKIYGFYELQEIWFITNKLDVDTIMAFNDSICDFSKQLDVDIVLLLVGEHEICSYDLPKFDCEIEV